MPRLLIEASNGCTDVFALSLPRTAIGRAPGNHLVLDDLRTSRFHAVVDREASFFIIRDLFSKNGLYINGRRVHARALRSGDTVLIGDCRARFIADEDFVEVVAETRASLPGQRELLVDSRASELLTP
jgi:pSer/pThr/pTyr-binding forkhead associated (FHA) protein